MLRVQVSNATSTTDAGTVEGAFSRLSKHTRAQDCTLDLGGATLQLTSDWKCPTDPQKLFGKGGGTPHSTAQLFQGGGTISNGTLDLGDAGVLCLHGASAVEFSNVVIQGADLAPRRDACCSPLC